MTTPATPDRCPKCNAVARVITTGEPDVNVPPTYDCPTHGEFWWEYEKAVVGKFYDARPVFRRKGAA